jgi:hypothetical protein
MGEETPKLRPLGLDRLSPDGLVLLSMFIHKNMDGQLEDRLGEVFDEELRNMPDRDLAEARAKIEELARSEHRGYRQAACDLVPYLALKDPESGYPLWGELMRDDNSDVRETAAMGLAKHIGVLPLDMERVVELIGAHYEAGG